MVPTCIGMVERTALECEMNQNKNEIFQNRSNDCNVKDETKIEIMKKKNGKGVPTFLIC